LCSGPSTPLEPRSRDDQGDVRLAACRTEPPAARLQTDAATGAAGRMKKKHRGRSPGEPLPNVQTRPPGKSPAPPGFSWRCNSGRPVLAPPPARAGPGSCRPGTLSVGSQGSPRPAFMSRRAGAVKLSGAAGWGAGRGAGEGLPAAFSPRAGRAWRAARFCSCSANAAAGRAGARAALAARAGARAAFRSWRRVLAAGSSSPSSNGGAAAASAWATGCRTSSASRAIRSPARAALTAACWLAWANTLGPAAATASWPTFRSLPCWARGSTGTQRAVRRASFSRRKVRTGSGSGWGRR